MVAWNPLSFNVSIEMISDQLIHYKVSTMSTHKVFGCSFVYGFNSMVQRMAQWEDMLKIAGMMKIPWIIMGGFNCILNREKRIGAAVRDAEIEDFRRCVITCNLEDIRSTGCYYTWNNKQTELERVFGKLDRVMGNKEWLEAYPSAEAHFMLEGLLIIHLCWSRFTL